MARWNKQKLDPAPTLEGFLEQLTHIKNKKERLAEAERMLDDTFWRPPTRGLTEKGRATLRQNGRRLQIEYWGDGKYEGTIRDMRLQQHKDCMAKLREYHEEQRSNETRKGWKQFHRMAFKSCKAEYEGRSKSYELKKKSRDWFQWHRVEGTYIENLWLHWATSTPEIDIWKPTGTTVSRRDLAKIPAKIRKGIKKKSNAKAAICHRIVRGRAADRRADRREAKFFSGRA